MKLAYGSMVFIRALIVGDCGRSLAQTCVITTRYSAVRRQTEIRPGYDFVVDLIPRIEIFLFSSFSD